jgi:hypothetical protein
MSQLTAISASPTSQTYAAGAIQRRTRKVANFLAPTVPVATPHGIYKLWSEKSRFFIPNTIRALSGDATEVSVAASDVFHDCEPHALTNLVDQSLGQNVDLLAKDSSDLLADIFGLAHLFEVVTVAKAAAGAGDNHTVDPSLDPVGIIDGYINSVLLAGKCEQVGVIFGALAWGNFKNHPLVKSRPAPLKWELNPALFNAEAQYMSCFSVVDTTPEGIDPVMDFILKDEIIVFGTQAEPTRRDPSFMKTFRVQNVEEVLRIVPTKDGRKLQVMLDWAAQVAVTNTAAVKRINYAAA